jgi:hypothetical protein
MLQGSWVVPVAGDDPMRGGNRSGLASAREAGSLADGGPDAGALDGIGGRTASTRFRVAGTTRSINQRPVSTSTCTTEASCRSPSSSHGAIHRRSTRGWERIGVAGVLSAAAVAEPEAPEGAEGALAGAVAGFGRTEAGTGPWVEFAYTPETEVHCVPTGALQA